jgi:hypothetical protein
MGVLDDGDAVVLDQDQLQLIQELATAREAKKYAEGQESVSRAGIINILAEGASDVGITGSGAQVCHIQRQTRTNINRAKLEAKYPEVFADVIEEVEVVVLKLD